jgi:hypothetical protein
MANAPNSSDFSPRPDSDDGASPHDDSAVRVLRYLDNDLKGKNLEEFRAHLVSCADCLAQVQAEEALSRLLHRTRPLYSAPAAVRARVSAAVVEHSGTVPRTNAPYQRVLRFLSGQSRGTGQRVLSLRVLAPVLLALAACMTFVLNIVRQVDAANYAQAAVIDHRSYLDGRLSLGLQSNSPQAVMAWFAGKVPFDFRLPSVESFSDNRPIYKLTGAALVRYKGNPAALVTYESHAGNISLLVASAYSAVVAGGNEVQFGKLTFHYRAEGNYRVITWNNHDLAYALVSAVAGSAKVSCLVCHQGMADRKAYQAQP